LFILSFSSVGLEVFFWHLLLLSILVFLLFLRLLIIPVSHLGDLGGLKILLLLDLSGQWLSMRQLGLLLYLRNLGEL
jgi:hypothetical protein